MLYFVVSLRWVAGDVIDDCCADLVGGSCCADAVGVGIGNFFPEFKLDRFT